MIEGNVYDTNCFGLTASVQRLPVQNILRKKRKHAAYDKHKSVVQKLVVGCFKT